MDPEMARQQRQEEALTIKAQENGKSGGAAAPARVAPLITRFFASPRPGTSLALIPRRNVAALSRPPLEERPAPSPAAGFALYWGLLLIAAGLVAGLMAFAAAQAIRAVL